MLRPYQLPSGAHLSVETEGQGFQANSPLTSIKMSNLLTPLVEFCDVALEQIRALAQQPEEIGLKIGVKIGVEGQVIIAKGTSEANIEVTLCFKRPS